MSGLKMKYFVLNPTKDDSYGHASRQALRAYANSIEKDNELLSKDLRQWASDEETQRTNNQKIQEASSLSSALCEKQPTKSEVDSKKQCPECNQNKNSGMNFCAFCGRELWNR